MRDRDEVATTLLGCQLKPMHGSLIGVEAG